MRHEAKRRRAGYGRGLIGKGPIVRRRRLQMRIPDKKIRSIAQQRKMFSASGWQVLEGPSKGWM